MSSTILLVDDEPPFERMVRQRLRKQIKAGTLVLLFAADGLEALELLAKNSQVDMVLTDINMPNMDGLTLISELNKRYPLIKSVVVSAYGDMKNIRTAMNLGAFDFITKPMNFGDFEKTVAKTLHQVELLKKVKEADQLAQKNEQLIELDQLKSQFFTNISHEFRTPLTVINGMTQQIRVAPDKWMDRGLSMIERNTVNLMNLVNQILDLRKAEAGKLSLDLVQRDILPLFHYIVESFQAIAETRDIKLHFINTRSEIILDHDEEKIQRILSNLLANAIKFTPENGDIYFFIEIDNEQLKLSIKDTGIGIPTTQLPHIFDRFHQVGKGALNTQKGTGIGLALTKELVQLMDGSIEVESQLDKGTTFTVTLPIRNTATKNTTSLNQANLLPLHTDEIIEGSMATASIIEGAVSENAPRVLIIEDNFDVAQYISSCLEGTYQIAFAENGAIGINKALEQIPDLIISDVMMPQKDGFEVVQTLKQDIRTNHIPIVLLSAKVDIESKLEGLERGADIYLAKPFDKKELLIHLSNLLKNREKLRLRYTSLTSEEASPAVLTPEDEFVQRIRDIIETNLDNYTFGSKELGKAIMMSRSQLFLKLKALTGCSASQYIRLLRLNKAKILLTTTQLNVSQVAYDVGFSDPKYFSRVFSKEFGVPPTQYAEK